MAAKEGQVGYVTGATLFFMCIRLSDGKLLNDADGSFATAPADPYVALSEHGAVKGVYTFSESRTVWTDGKYLFAFYERKGGSPAPATDPLISVSGIEVLDDAEYTLTGVNAGSLTGLVAVFQKLRQELLRLTESGEDVKKKLGSVLGTLSQVENFARRGKDAAV